MKREVHYTGSDGIADNAEVGPTLTQVGLIPGLERLVPGTHDPRQLVRSRYGTWKLPVRFHGRSVLLIANGALFGL